MNELLYVIVLYVYPTLPLTQNGHHSFMISTKESTVSHHQVREEEMEVFRVAAGHNQLNKGHMAH